ncbi:MAG: hypothetical protein SFW62_07425 [Alphaproteobacteria bacterium]|nr:hypothetical protein [Alphaproteobacteria bacterium]
MRDHLKILTILAVLATPLAVNLSAYAEPTDGSPAPVPAPMPQSSETPAGGPPHSGLREEQRIERKEFREAIGRMRGEHEELMAERDRLKMQCMNVKGQERAECQAKSQGLREKSKALHERRMELNQKIKAEHAENRKERQEVRQEHREKKAERRKEHMERKADRAQHRQQMKQHIPGGPGGTPQVGGGMPAAPQ